MMTTNLFFLANVKQLRTYIVLEFYFLFSEHLGGVGVLNSAIFNSFHNWVEFGTILEHLRNFGWGALNPPTPLGTPLVDGIISVQHVRKLCTEFESVDRDDDYRAGQPSKNHSTGRSGGGMILENRRLTVQDLASALELTVRTVNNIGRAPFLQR